MNAAQAKELTLEAKNSANSLSNIQGIAAKKLIDEQIENAARAGKFQVKIDLRAPQFVLLNNKILQMRDEFQAEGFSVEFLLTRTPNGAREMIIKW